MKHSLFAVRLETVLLLLLVSSLSIGTGLAQLGGPGGPAGMSSALAKMFGDVKGTAKAEVQVFDSSDKKEKASMPMDFAFLDGKVRVEVNLEQMKNSSMPPGAAAQLKQMGMAQVISIILPDKKEILVAYPELKMMLSMPLPKDESDKEALQKKALGKETVDGHPCVKNQIEIPDDKGQKVEMTTWNATDMKDFPIKIETMDKGNTSIVHFTKVQLTSPEPKLFEAPAGYTKYNSPQELMQAIMSKMGQPQGGAPK